MKQLTNSYLLLGILYLITLVSPAKASDSDLQSGFANPPDSAKPRTWWHWISGNVSSEGITADLKAMKQIGLGGAQIFTVDQSEVKGSVVFLSPEWRKLVHQSMVEAQQLNLEMSMEGCDGWSESGGHWVTPKQAMQKVVWSSSVVEGGQSVSLELPQPETQLGYYEDIGLYAFPAMSGDNFGGPEQITASSSDFVPGKTEPTISAPLSVTNTQGRPMWIEYAFAQPITVGSIDFAVKHYPRRAHGELQISNDGKSFHKVCDLWGNGSFSFDPTTGKFLRIQVSKAPEIRKSIDFTTIHFGGARVSQWTARTGMAVHLGLPFDDSSLTNGDLIDPKTIVDLTGKKEWVAPSGKWTLLRLGHTCTGARTHPSTSPGLEVDKLSRVAVEAHIKNLFTPVWDDNPQQIGGTFRYILLDSWEAGCENWTTLLPDDFRKRRGYDLRPWLPALTGRVILSQDATNRFLWDYRRTLADLVADNHYGTFQDEAHARQMGLMSEAPGISIPTVADELQCKGHTDIPMGEFWVNRSADDNVDDPKETSSAAHIYGQNIAATESYTSRPTTAAWTNDPYSLKMLGDQEFCLGVNRFIFHRYAHQPWLDRAPGMSMGPWGINFERTNTWWEPGSAWISYISRCQYLLQKGQFVADLCYFYGEDAPATLRHQQLVPAVPPGYDYDACNADILLNQMSVADGALKLKSGMKYRVLVLPDIDRMSLPVAQKIESLVKDGAVVYGPKPVKSPSLTGYPESDQKLQAIAEAVWGNCDGKTVTEHAYGKGKIVWGEPLATAINQAADFESTQPNVLDIHRLDGDTDIYFVSNQQNKERVVQATFRVTGKVPEFWHPDSGTIETAALYHQADGRTTVPIHFDPSGSVFVIFNKTGVDAIAIDSFQNHGQQLFTDGSSTDASQPVVTSGKVTFLAWQPGSYVGTTPPGKNLKAEVSSLPEALSVTAPWKVTFPPKLGAPETTTFDNLISWPNSPIDGIKYFSGTATYQTDLSIPPDFLGTGRKAYLDLGEVKNLAQISINGKSLGILWKPPFRLDVTAAVSTGINHLEIKVTNLWPNRLIGDEHLPKEQRVTWASVSLYQADSPLLPSGLIGPVKLVPAQEVSLAP